MNQLKLQVILAAVDKITAPLKRMRESASSAAGAVRITQANIKQLNTQAGQIDGYRKVSRQLGFNSRELAKAQQEVARLAQEMRASSSPSKELARSYDKARSEAQRLTLQQKQLSISQQRQRDALRASGIDTRNLSNHQRQLSRDLASANQQLLVQKQRLEQVARQQRQLDAARNRYQQTRQLQGQMAGAGAVAAGTGIASLYAGSQLLQPGLEFGASQSRVQALTRLESDDPRLLELRTQARQLGASTSFTATDISAGQAFLAMAGFTPASIKAAMPSMLDLAKAGDLDLATSADIASNILSAFKLPAAEMTKVADVMALTMTTSNVNLQMLGETMKYVAPIAQSVGMSLEETAAAAGMLGNIGIQASQSGTVLRSMLNRLAGPSTAAANIMSELGLNAKDAQGNLRNITEILAETARLTENFGNADRIEIYKELFGEEAAAGINELISQSGAGEFAKYARQITEQHNGVAAKIATTMANNAKGDIDELKSAWADIGIELFEGNNSAIRDFIRQLTGVVRSIGDWMKANPELTATLFKLAATLAILAAVGGTLTLVVAGLLGPLAMMRFATAFLGITALPNMAGSLTRLSGVLRSATAVVVRFGVALMATPVGWIIAAIAAIAVAALLIYKYWEPIKAFLGGVWDGLVEGFATVVDALRPLFGLLSQAIAPLVPLWDMLSGAISKAWQWLSALLEPFKATQEQLDAATSSGKQFGKWLADIILFLPNTLSAFHNFGERLITSIIDGITSKLSALRSTLTGAATDALGWFKDTLGLSDTQETPAKTVAREAAAPARKTLATSAKVAGLALGLSTAVPAQPQQPVSPLLPTVTDANYPKTQMLQAVPAPHIANTQRTITQHVTPAELPAVTDAQRSIKHTLQTAPAPHIANTQRTITQHVTPVELPAVSDAQRSIKQSLQAAPVTDIADTQRTITQHVTPAMLPAVTDAQRSIKQMLQTAPATDIADTQRTITQHVTPAVLPAVTDAQRAITQTLQAVPARNIADTQRAVNQTLTLTPLPDIAPALRTINEHVKRADVGDVADVKRTITEQKDTTQRRITTSPRGLISPGMAIAPAQQSSPKTITVDATVSAPITIHAAPGMDTQQLAQAIAQELAKRERAQEARIRATLNDLE